MKLVIGNLKMNLISSEINDYINYFKDKKYDNVIFAPTSIYLSRFVHNGLTSASQDVGMENSGAYTGDISPVQLLSIGVKYSLVGHSERRKYYFDSLNVAKKIKSLIDNKMIPILCIGETLSEKNDVGVEKILSEQIKKGDFKKTYLAVISNLKQKSGTLCDYIEKKEDGTSVITTKEKGKYAELSYKEIARQDNYSLVEINLKTGRHHQIRVQFKNISSPLYGDQRYGIEDKNQLCLFAYKLEFFHPTTKEKLIFKDYPNYSKFNLFKEVLK